MISYQQYSNGSESKPVSPLGLHLLENLLFTDPYRDCLLGRLKLTHFTPVNLNIMLLFLHLLLSQLNNIQIF